MNNKQAPSLNLDRLRERENAMVSNGKFGRLKDGKTILRLFTFDHLVTQQDYDQGIYREGSPFAPEIGSWVREVDVRLTTHYVDGKVVPCEGPGCPHCAAAAQARDITAKKSLSARQQFQVNAVDVELIDEGVKMWTLPTSVYKEILSIINSGELEADQIFGHAGRDFIIKKDKNQPPSSMYKVMLRESSKCVRLLPALDSAVTDLVVEKSNRFGAPAAVKSAPAAPAAPAAPVAAAPKKATNKKPAVVGATVSFVDSEGQKVGGTITSVNGSEITVEDGEGEEWIMEENDFKVM